MAQITTITSSLWSAKTSPMSFNAAGSPVEITIQICQIVTIATVDASSSAVSTVKTREEESAPTTTAASLTQTKTSSARERVSEL